MKVHHFLHAFAQLNMLKINTFVFFDIETTGLPEFEPSPTKITELALIACSREHLLETKTNEIPRVLHKLLLPIQPMKCILPDTTIMTSKTVNSWND